MKKYRVAKCKHTKKPVLQMLDGEQWLCLHKENDTLDRVSVDAFLAGQGQLKKLKRLYPKK